ncbi:MAG: hypothetical protein DRP11_02715 [Candidatus Aenigmatarchaeota archaeon]|nr:MAG: hypothetical protein DRP11_02715 [Candidatus Aenigmarchaeota archaeon]
MKKCKICGRPFDEHRYRVTFFEQGAKRNQIVKRTEHADHVDVHDGFVWLTDDCVTEATNLDRVYNLIITKLNDEEGN